MRTVIAVACLATIGFAQSRVVVEGSLTGGGRNEGLSIEVSGGNGGMRMGRAQVGMDSSFRIELPMEGGLLEFRILNQRGDVIQVIHQTAQKGIPVELRLSGTHRVTTSQAAISLKRLTMQPPSKMRRAFALSQKLRMEGRQAESLVTLQEIVRTEPQWFEAWMELGICQSLLKNPTAAVEALQQAVAIDPNAAEVYPVLAFALLHAGRVEEATEMAQKGLKLTPDVVQAKYALGLAMASARPPSLRAVALLEEVQAHFPDAMLPLAELLLRLGKFEASRDAAWRYLHMAKSPRSELAGSIWRAATNSLKASDLR